MKLSKQGRLTEMLDGLSWLGSLIGDVSIKIEKELESLE